MLYDPKWKKPAPAKVGKPTLRGFISFLAEQNPKETYHYETHQCAIGKYLKSVGTNYYDWLWPLARDQADPDAQCKSADWNNNITVQFPRTYGAALKRARAYQRKAGK